jgi:D-alanyl-D-alanine carboxypeptidase/D-alanyl-D-alanine-endopeptidase (penicillin-binding protein 4)
MPSWKPSRRIAYAFFAVAVILLLTGARRRPLSLKENIDREIATSSAIRSAYLGMQVSRLSDGKVLYQRNPGHLFVPASNTKLFTTALALTRLGPDYRFVTTVVADHGDLILIGGGDPSLSARTYPYSTDPTTGDPLKPIEDLADQVVAGGLKSVQGNVVGDDSRYPWAPYADGWNSADELWEYGAPVSALMINDNRLDLTIAPGNAEGELAHLTLTPQFEFMHIDNRVRTVSAGAVNTHIGGSMDARQLQVWGTILLGGAADQDPLAISDPALFAAALLRDALIRRGVNVSGPAVARHRYLDDIADPERGDPPPAPAPGTELARRLSPPLSELLQVVNKVSQNLHAEVMLREVGAARRNIGTAAAGLAELHDFLAEIAIPDDEYEFVDGSGLSRGTLVEPQAIVKLLQYMWNSPNREAWVGLLPVGGQDGSLRKRFKDHPEAARIHAKTGSLSHVRALSGYAQMSHGGTVAFSILLNNYLAPDAEVARFLDNIGLKLLR